VTRTVTVPKSTPESPGDERGRKLRGVCALFPAKPQDLPANPRAYLGVHVQKLNGGAANVRKTQDPSVVRRPEMIVPAVSARVDQSRENSRLRVEARQIWSLLAVAEMAGKRQVVGLVAAASGLRSRVPDTRREDGHRDDVRGFSSTSHRASRDRARAIPCRGVRPQVRERSSVAASASPPCRDSTIGTGDDCLHEYMDAARRAIAERRFESHPPPPTSRRRASLERLSSSSCGSAMGADTKGFTPEAVIPSAPVRQSVGAATLQPRLSRGGQWNQPVPSSGSARPR
jgi:hypothetical protein